MLLLLILLLPLFSIPSSKANQGKCKSLKHETDSQAYYDEGERLWNEAQHAESIPFYRAAVRLCPESAIFWWKLGNAEWRQGYHSRAYERYERSRAVNHGNEGFPYPSDYKEINEGIFETNPVREVLSHSHYMKFPPLYEKQEIQDLADLGKEEYPYVVRGFLLESDLKWETLFNMIDLFPASHSMVEFYPQNMRTKPTKVFRRSLKEAVEFLNYPEGAYTAVDISKSGTYIQWNLNFTNFQNLFYSFTNSTITPSRIKNDLYAFLSFLIQRLPEQHRERYFTDISSYFITNQPEVDEKESNHRKSNLVEQFAQQTHWYMLLIGEQDAGMFHHVDNLPVASWQLQIAGDKKWILCDPIPSSITPVSPESLMEDADKRCNEVILHPGDLLYYPKYYSHETLSLSFPTISISGTVVPPRDYGVFVDFICQECEDNRVGYKFHRELCLLVGPSCTKSILHNNEDDDTEL